MAVVSRIVSVELLRDECILINLFDGTSIHLTLDQLLSLGVPTFRIPEDDNAFEKAMRETVEDGEPAE